MTDRWTLAVPGLQGGCMSVLDMGDRSRAPDMIFTHANGFNALTYRTLLEPLTREARILAPDLRGHGRSTLAARPGWRRSWRDLRDDLVALIDAVEGPPMALAGAGSRDPA